MHLIGRYAHRVAISNDRLVNVEAGYVRFRWLDYAHGHRLKIMTLSAEEFLRRFLLHVIPAGFVRIRHFGFLANRGRIATLSRCRALLAVPPPTPPRSESVAALVHRLTGVDITHCPRCRAGRLRLLVTFRPGVRPVPALDSSWTRPVRTAPRGLMRRSRWRGGGVCSPRGCAAPPKPSAASVTRSRTPLPVGRPPTAV